MTEQKHIAVLAGLVVAVTTAIAGAGSLVYVQASHRVTLNEVMGGRTEHTELVATLQMWPVLAGLAGLIAAGVAALAARPARTRVQVPTRVLVSR